MDKPDVAVELAEAVGQKLPPRYIEFLDGLHALPTLGPSYSPILDFGGREWRPYSRKMLIEEVRYNRGPKHPQAHETIAIANDLRQGDAENDGEMSAVIRDKGFTLDRLARGFCIGSENGAPLFVDAESGAVYGYCHDGMDVELWTESLVTLIETSKAMAMDEDE